MSNILEYLREFFNPKLQTESVPTLSVKRNRYDDDDPPMKRYRTVPNHFPKVMPREDEEEWRFPRLRESSHKERIIPITLEDRPSTSTPSTSLNVGRKSSAVKPLEGFHFEKYLNKPASGQLRRLTDVIEPKTSKLSFVPREKSLFFNDDPVKLNMPQKPSLLNFDLSDIQMPSSSSQNRFFKRSSPIFPDLQSKRTEDDSDPYKFTRSLDGPKQSYKYFKNTKISDKPSDNIEVIELSDTEDSVYYVVKEPKRTAHHLFHNNEEDDSQDDEEDESRPCRTCKSKSSMGRFSERSSRSPHRIRAPLSLSKARLLNSFTPFWKSQKSNSNKRIGKMKLLESTRAIAEKCFRLDDKKKYEELIKLSNKSSFRRNSNAQSINSLTDTQKHIQDLASSISKGDLLDSDEYSNRTERVTDEIIVLSDNDQPASPDDSSTSSVKVVPVNSLKHSLKANTISSPNWMDELNRKYKNIKIQQEIEDSLQISSTHSKSNRDQWLKLRTKQLESLRIDLTVEPEIPKEVPLPELTEDQLNIIQYALKPNPPNQVLVQKFNLDITRRDINTLAGLNWLNDEVINFYMNLIMQRSLENKEIPKTYAMNTFFYPKLMQSGQAGLRRWTRKVDIFSYHIIVIPIHLGVHWCMSVIDFRNKSIRYFDSMGGKNMDCCDALLKYLQDESLDKKQQTLDTSGWTKECVKDIPQQMNGSDCGMFSCTFAEFLSRDAPITFSQNEMPYLRRKMVLEIVQGKLLL